MLLGVVLLLCFVLTVVITNYCCLKVNRNERRLQMRHMARTMEKSYQTTLGIVDSTLGSVTKHRDLILDRLWKTMDIVKETATENTKNLTSMKDTLIQVITDEVEAGTVKTITQNKENLATIEENVTKIDVGRVVDLNVLTPSSATIVNMTLPNVAGVGTLSTHLGDLHVPDGWM